MILLQSKYADHFYFLCVIAMLLTGIPWCPRLGIGRTTVLSEDIPSSSFSENWWLLEVQLMGPRSKEKIKATRQSLNSEIGEEDQALPLSIFDLMAANSFSKINEGAIGSEFNRLVAIDANLCTPYC